MVWTTISGAAMVALASTIFFLLVVKAWSAFARATTSTRFAGSIMREAAQRYRDELASLGREQSFYLTSALTFTVVFCISYVLPAEELYAQIPHWQLIIVLVLFSIAAIFLLFRLVTIAVARRRLFFVRDAGIATGHALQKLTANQNRVFFDVPVHAGVIDNVIVGLQGVYTISVIARPAGKDNRARLKGDRLLFAGADAISLIRRGKKSKQLAKNLRKIISQDIHIRSVICIPGWEIDSQESNEYLLVNEHNIAMLTGWRDQTDNLLSEDVEAMHEMLTAYCTQDRKPNA